MEGDVWVQATLPVCAGGLGIRSASELSLSAYLVSVCSVSHLVTTIFIDGMMEDIQAAVQAWEGLTAAEPPIAKMGSMQKSWDNPLVMAAQ